MTEMRPPRQQQFRRTRDRIMNAVADELIERNAHDVSVQAVADRAGVSHRTVYRYFATKQELFEGFGSWLIEISGGRERSIPSPTQRVGEWVVSMFGWFADNARYVEAYARLTASGMRLNERSERMDAYGKVIASFAPQMGARHQRAMIGLMRQITAPHSWVRARDEAGADPEALADVGAWMLERLTAATQAGEFPEEWKDFNDVLGERVG